MIPSAYDISGENIARFIEIIKRKYKIDFSGYSLSFLRRRIASRMNRTKITSVEEYYNYLQNSPQELSLLLQNLTINVSEFMRNPEVFDIIQTKLIPELLKKFPDETIKIWTAGCSRGEEPYSVAIVLHRLGIISPERAKIIATDIDEVALSEAREGIYQAQSLKNLSDSDKKIFFRRTSDGKFKIVPSVKKMVAFKRHNIVADGMIDRFHLIICRNVAIYLGKQFQRKMYNRLINDLISGCYLIIGKSEMLPSEFHSAMTPFDLENRIYQKV